MLNADAKYRVKNSRPYTMYTFSNGYAETPAEQSDCLVYTCIHVGGSTGQIEDAPSK